MFNETLRTYSVCSPDPCGFKTFRKKRCYYFSQSPILRFTVLLRGVWNHQAFCP